MRSPSGARSRLGTCFRRMHPQLAHSSSSGSLAAVWALLRNGGGTAGALWDPWPCHRDVALVAAVLDPDTHCVSRSTRFGPGSEVKTSAAGGSEVAESKGTQKANKGEGEQEYLCSWLNQCRGGRAYVPVMVQGPTVHKRGRAHTAAVRAVAGLARAHPVKSGSHQQEGMLCVSRDLAPHLTLRRPAPTRGGCRCRLYNMSSNHDRGPPCHRGLTDTARDSGQAHHEQGSGDCLAWYWTKQE